MVLRLFSSSLCSEFVDSTKTTAQLLCAVLFIHFISEHDSLTVRALACHAADPGSNPAGGDDFFN